MAEIDQTIIDFYSVAQDRDFARTNLFRVLDMSFGDASPEVFNQADMVYATTATLPGKTITDVPLPYMGLEFHVPGTVKYNNSAAYVIKFRADAAYGLYQKFQKVISDTFDDESSTGNYATPKGAYMTLIQLDKEMSKLAEYKLEGVSIRAIGDLSYDVTQAGEIQTFDVTVAYQFYRRQAD